MVSRGDVDDAARSVSRSVGRTLRSAPPHVTYSLHTVYTEYRSRSFRHVEEITAAVGAGV